MANPNIVAVTNILGGNLGWNLSATLDATLITVTAEYVLKINRIICTNVDGSSAYDLNLLVSGMGSGTTGITTTGADSDVYLAKTISVPADSALVVTDTPIYLMEGDILKGGGSTVNKLDLFISYETIID